MSLSITMADQDCVDAVWRVAQLGSEIVSKGRIHRPEDVAGARADDDAGLAGLVTWRADADDVELVSIDSFRRAGGVGRALLEHCRETARASGARRLWLVTTNDNLNALGFYQHCGLRLCALRPNELERSRGLKPAIPEIGANGLPLRDELELECAL